MAGPSATTLSVLQDCAEHCTRTRWEEAERILDLMEEKGIIANSITYTASADLFFPADLSDAAANADGPAIALKRFPMQMPFSPSVAIGGCRWHVRNKRRSALRPLLKAYANAFPPVPNEARPPFAQTHACQ